MASYFDEQPHHKADAKVVGLAKAGNGEFGQTSLLSPQVTRILDDLDDHSSSSSSEDSQRTHTDDEDRRGRSGDKDPESLQKSRTSPLPRGGRKSDAHPPPRSGLGASKREKQPHFARFHSLRSMLFSAQIEDKIAMSQEEQEQQEAEAKWKAEHDQRRGLNRPKTPESPKGSPTKEGFGHRMASKLKRMTSKEAPSLDSISEDGNDSTASDDEVPAGAIETGKKWDERVVSDDESIHHSDVEDLVRWVSRRDPPSDGEGRRGRQQNREPGVKEGAALDSGRGSLGHQDVADLVQWVSRRPEPEEERHDLPSDYGDVSTESDSEAGGAQKQDSEDEDVDELRRWVSRKEGPKAGPLKEQKAAPVSNLSAPEGVHDSDTEELKRWTTRHDDTSGESDMEAIRNQRGRKTGRQDQERGSLGQQDVDELVRWVSRRDDNTTAGATKAKDEKALTDGDVDDLVRWVSRRNDNPQQENQEDDEVLKWKKEEDEKKAEVGMTRDHGSLAHEDVEELVGWVSRRHDSEQPETQQDDDVARLRKEEDAKKAEVGMTRDHGSLAHEDVDELVGWVSRRNDNEQRESQHDEEATKIREEEDAKKAEVGMTRDHGSLAHEDVDELVKWVSKK